MALEEQSGLRRDTIGQKEIADTGALLRKLWETVDKTTFEQWLRGSLILVQQKKVLRFDLLCGVEKETTEKAEVCEVGQGCSEVTDTERELRELWETGCNGHPPQGWEPVKQFARELNKALQEVSYQRTPAEVFLLCMWQASESEKSLRQSLQSVYAEVGERTTSSDNVITSWSPKMWKERNGATNPLLATDYKDPQVVIRRGVSGNTAESRKAREEVAAGARDGVTESVFYESGPGWISEGFGCLRAEGENRPSRPTHTVVARTVSAKWAKGTGGPAGDECQNLVAFGPGGQGDIAHAIRSQPSKADKPSSTTYIVDAIPINDKATRYKGGGATRNADGSGNGLGIGKPGDPMPTLTQGDRHAVAQLYENHGQDSRLTGPLDVAPTVHRKYGTGGNNTPLVTRGFEGDIARTLTARHDSSPCVDRGQDLVFAIRTAQLYENHAVRSFTPSQFGQYQEGCGTLRANGGDLGGGSENLVSNNYTVRRLTVIECLRLQGFPDWWFDGVPGYSDTQGYKAVGNSIAVPCVDWIMGRIKPVIRPGQAIWVPMISNHRGHELFREEQSE